MGEIRVDPLSGLRVLFAPGPRQEGDAAPPPSAPAFFDAAFPALTPGAEAPAREAALDLFTSAAARGGHEVVEHGPDPVAALAHLGADALARTAERWRERMAAHPEAAHVHLVVDEGGPGAASRAELFALDFVPAAVARERERCRAYATRSQGADLLGDLVQAEVRQRVRLVAYDDEAVLLSPYAARVPFQLMLVPRTPRPRFESPGVLGAALLHRGLQALAARFGRSPPLTAWVRTAPRGAEHFCWRIDVLPRLAPPGGLELGTGLALNPVLPEQATAELRAALAR